MRISIRHKRKRTNLGNGDASTRRAANLANLATGTTDDATNHVRGNADVLGLKLLAVLVMSGGSTRGLGVRATVEGALVRAAEISAVASASDSVVAAVVIVTAVVVEAGASSTASARNLGANGRVVQDSASAALPVVNQALGNLPNSTLNTLRGTLDFNDTLSRLRKHVLLRNHADTRGILDLLDLETRATNDSAHLVVRNQKLEGCENKIAKLV